MMILLFLIRYLGYPFITLNWCSGFRLHSHSHKVSQGIQQTLLFHYLYYHLRYDIVITLFGAIPTDARFMIVLSFLMQIVDYIQLFLVIWNLLVAFHYCCRVSLVDCYNRCKVRSDSTTFGREIVECVAYMRAARFDDQIDCSICKEPFGESQKLLFECGHVYHTKCIHEWEEFVKNRDNALISRKCNCLFGCEAVPGKSTKRFVYDENYRIPALASGFLPRDYTNVPYSEWWPRNFDQILDDRIFKQDLQFLLDRESDYDRQW